MKENLIYSRYSEKTDKEKDIYETIKNTLRKPWKYLIIMQFDKCSLSE